MTDPAATIAAFLASATPEDIADLATLCPVVQGRRARIRGHHAAAQRQATTTRQASADAMLTSLLRVLTGKRE